MTIQALRRNVQNFFSLDIFYYGLFHGLYLSRESCGHSSHGSSERNFYFYYTDTPGECPELFLIKKMIQNGFETDLLTCLIMNRQG